jgi:hypothetical protein
MSAPDYSQALLGSTNVNVLPTERLAAIVEQHNRMAEALIEIAAGFAPATEGGRAWCRHCGWSANHGCVTGCPGLLARRALGVA